MMFTQAKEKRSGKTAPTSWANSLKARRMDMGFTNGQTLLCTRATGPTTK